MSTLTRLGALLGALALALVLYQRHWHHPVPPWDLHQLPANPEAENDLKRLGLTPKPSVKIIDDQGNQRVIYGRFLHITDFHPDIYYKEGSSISNMCHSGKGSDGDRASKYGDAVLGCDSPLALFNETVQYIKENFKDKIDFIVWTGDNIRHDNDRDFPRSESAIFQSNEMVSNVLFDAFKSDKSSSRALDVDLVPSLGNNDVYPHNLFATGPTLQIRELYRVWKDYIPHVQMHTFAQGAYFFKEIIPNQLAVLSINTLYLFDSNPLTDDCDSPKDPGYKVFEWLGYVLKELRARKMKVWLSGHVPPNEKNYDVTCLRKYVVWTHEYRDVIIGGLYGHMNMDHFYTYDSVKAYKSIDEDFGKRDIASFVVDDASDSDSDSDDEFDISDVHNDTEPYGATNYWKVFNEEYDNEWFRIKGGVPYNKVNYMESVREDVYADVKKKKKSGKHGERYSVAQVGTSIVPTFNPGFRIYEYNISTLHEQDVKFVSWDEFFAGVNREVFGQDQVVDFGKKKKKIDRDDKTFPPKMPKKAQLGPAYTPQLFTPERYVQYYLDLASVNKGKKKFAYEIEYASEDVGLKTLLVDEWLKYARKLGAPVNADDADTDTVDTKGKKKKGKKKNKGKKKKGKFDEEKKMWEDYLKHSFASCDYENMGYG